jgi:hypothetical protein
MSEYSNSTTETPIDLALYQSLQSKSTELSLQLADHVESIQKQMEQVK